MSIPRILAFPFIYTPVFPASMSSCANHTKYLFGIVPSAIKGAILIFQLPHTVQLAYIGEPLGIVLAV